VPPGARTGDRAGSPMGTRVAHADVIRAQLQALT
jgi:hypothetical protein